MAKSEMEYMCDEPEGFTTTKTKLMAITRNAESMARLVAESIDDFRREAAPLIKDIHADIKNGKKRREGWWKLGKRVIGNILKDGEELVK